jgi:hypothetical protein
MVVHHIIPADRLNKKYFRRWFYWRGVSRALLYQQQGLDMEAPERRRLDLASVRHVGGVPRYLYRTAARTLTQAIAARVRGDAVAAFEHELWLCMFAGIVRQRWRDRHEPPVWAHAAQVPGVPA